VESQETTTEDGAAETGSEGAEPREPPLPGLLTPNPHDEEGVGEENEETVHAVKLKAYRMRRASEQGGSGWAELGMGESRSPPVTRFPSDSCTVRHSKVEKA
jgi:nucleoporin NUP2